MIETGEVEYFGSPVPRTLSPRQAAARHAVLLVAADAFTSRGYAATSIDDIADRLGATKGRVYHYFRTKGEIFLGVHRRALDLMLEATREPFESDEPASSKLGAMAKAHALLMMTEPTFMRLATQLTEMSLAAEGRTRQEEIDAVMDVRREYEQRYETVIAEGIDAGEFSDDDPQLLATIVLGSLNGMTGWLDAESTAEGADRERIASLVSTFVTNGLHKRATAASRRPTRSRQRAGATA